MNNWSKKAALPTPSVPTGFMGWLREQLQQQDAAADLWIGGLEPLPGDAGSRHYYRFDTTICGEAAADYIAVFSPPHAEKNREFLQIAEHFRAAGVCVPQVFASDEKQGFFLLERFGGQRYFDVLSPGCAEKLYQSAFQQLLKIQGCEPSVWPYPIYDQAFLRRELCLFTEWFVAQLLQIPLADAEHQMLHAVFSELENSALRQAQVVTHRDFHSKNIMYRAQKSAGIIDFQDAVIGPVTYDLVSLLRDCYLEWPDAQVEHWALAYADLAQQAGIIQQFTPTVFLQAFDWMGLQRHIKVLGIFARLYLRDGKAGYLQDLPRVITYVRKVSAKYPQFAAFNQWFDQRLLPATQGQAWMSAKKESP